MKTKIIKTGLTPFLVCDDAAKLFHYCCQLSGHEAFNEFAVETRKVKVKVPLSKIKVVSEQRQQCFQRSKIMVHNSDGLGWVWLIRLGYLGP